MEDQRISSEAIVPAETVLPPEVEAMESFVSAEPNKPNKVDFSCTPQAQ